MDKFHVRYFSGTLKETKYEQHWLNPEPCYGGVECLGCRSFFCHDCVVALGESI